MNNNNNPTAGSGQGNNFFSGFLLGVLVGGVIVFILGTKKGKKLLEAISEEGKENISSILDKASKIDNWDEESEEPPMSGEEVKGKENPIEAVKPKIRRFFRGVSKRVN